MRDITTRFISRLQARDNDAWFELWETFGPILGAQLSRWGRGRIGRETVQDLSQETMAALAGAIDRHDPNRGARFSTWLLAIARYTLGDELDRRSAQKRGEGRRTQSLEAAHDQASRGLAPSAAYEQEVFDAKVEAALREVEHEVPFEELDLHGAQLVDGGLRDLQAFKNVIFRHLERAALDHRDRIGQTGNHDVDVGVLKLLEGGVDDPGALYSSDSHRCDRSIERHL